jgi:hypothetical protein
MNGMVHYNFKFIYMFMFSEFLDKNLYMKYVPSWIIELFFYLI